MCGIAGFKTARRVDERVLDQMVRALVHRGPDSEGFYRDGDYQAGMRRLSIVDIAHGDQPLFGADGGVVLLYNGEIYNYRELRRELEAKGHVFRTNSDGEVICHLYEYHGEDLFERLDGMFAAALWIAPERKLILARDLPGEKPLYYTEPSPGEVVFASEIAALKFFPGLDFAINRQALWDFPTFLWVPEPATVYSSVKALPRGHILSVSDGKSRLRAYQNRFDLTRLPADKDKVAETRRVVEGAIKSRLLSDVPVGSFLSGGLDSSIVATIAARELGRLDTFSVGFEDIEDPYHGRADETAAAARTAAIIGSRHHAIRVTAQTFRDELDTFCRHGDQPFGVSSGFGILAVAKAARDAGIKVLLSGDGADECFGGYSWYAHLDRKARNGAAVRNGVVSFQNIGLPISERLASIDIMPAPERAWAWHYYAHEEEKKALFCADFRDGVGSSLRHFGDRHHGGDWSPVDFVAQDREFYFPNEMLRKVDRMTMAYGVEGRVPFAAPSVLAFAETLKFPELIDAGGTLKTSLRQAFADVLPAEVVTRPKHGFNVPIDHWLKNEWSDLVDETFEPGSALLRSGIVASDAGDVARNMLADAGRLNGHTVFCMIMLNRWLEKERMEIIAEIGQNHNGDMELARQLIAEAKASGAGVAKFQVYSARDLFPKEGNEWFDYNCKTELSRANVEMLARECEDQGIEFMASVFDVERVSWLEAVGARRYKIASRSVRDRALIDAVAATGKPVIVSLGMWNEPSFPKLDVPGGVGYLYCVSKYPTEFADLHFEEVDFGRYVGFSDHTIGVDAAMMALSRGAGIIEKHFTLDKNMYGPDHSGSMTPAELAALSRFRDNLKVAL